MNTKSRIMLESDTYTACIIQCGLVITRKAGGGGVMLPPDHQDYPLFVSAIDDIANAFRGVRDPSEIKQLHNDFDDTCAILMGRSYENY